WCILFMTMMGFNDLDVVFVPQSFCHLADDLIDKIDAYAHVGRQYARSLGGKSCNFLELAGGKPGCADHRGSSMFCRCAQVMDRRFWRREIDNDIAFIKLRHKIVCDRDSCMSTARCLSCVAAQRTMPFPFDCTGQSQGGRVPN